MNEVPVLWMIAWTPIDGLFRGIEHYTPALTDELASRLRYLEYQNYRDVENVRLIKYTGIDVPAEFADKGSDDDTNFWSRNREVDNPI